MDAIPFGSHDRFEVVHRLAGVGFFVDHEIVEPANVGELVVRDLEPRGDLFVRLGAARFQARAQVRELVGDDEDQDRVRELLLDRERAVHFGLGHDVVAVPKLVLDERARHPVQVAVVLAPLEKCALRDAPPKLFMAQEEVVDVVALARVVAETEYRRRSWRALRPSTNVSLPAPDGPDTTNRSPGPVRTSTSSTTAQTRINTQKPGMHLPSSSKGRRVDIGYRLDPDSPRRRGARALAAPRRRGESGSSR